MKALAGEAAWGGRVVRGCLIALMAGTASARDPAPQQSTTGPMPPAGAMTPASLQPAPGAAVTAIAGLPAYLWRHGCGPTALGMILGYYDTHGFPDLLTGDGAAQSPEVNQQIASQGSGTVGAGAQRHYEDYALPDDSETGALLDDRSTSDPVGCHPADSVADLMRTSWSAAGNRYGWSWDSDIRPAFLNYAASRNPAYIARSTRAFMDSTLTWAFVTNELAGNRPLIFLVDSSGDGTSDHFLTAIGYSDGPPRQYASYDTWSTNVRWSEFRAMSNAYAWGVSQGWSFSLASARPPVVLGLTARQTTTDGTALIALTNRIAAADLSPCQMEIGVSVDGGRSWTNAWIRSASAAFGTVTVSNTAPLQLSGITTRNGASAVTNTVSLVWCATNAPAVRWCTNTLVRARAWDGANWSPAAVSAPFAVDSSAPPPRATPIDWLAAHGLTNGDWAAAEQADTDGDGAANWQEWTADTNPTNPGSVLRFVAARPGADGVRLEWTGGTAAWQYVETTLTPLGTAAWSAAATLPPPTPATTGIVVATPAGAALRLRARR